MGTLTMKGPDRALDGEEPTQIIPGCVIIIFRKGKAVNLREKQY